MAFENNVDETIGGMEQTNPFANQFGGLEESEQFPGAKIISFDRNGLVERYALSRNGEGKLTGSSFTLQEYKAYGETDGAWVNSSSSVRAAESESKIHVGGKDIGAYRIGPVYQLHEEDLEKLDTYLKEKGMTL